MKIEHTVDKTTSEHVFTITVNPVIDFDPKYYDEFDLALMDECRGSDNLADSLLMLEMMARRIDEYRDRDKLNPKKT